MPKTGETTPRVVRTEPLARFIPQGNWEGYVDRRKLRDRFDEHPIGEVREACLKSLGRSTYEDEWEWGSSRIREFLKIRDDDTALLILRWMIPANGDLRFVKNVLYVFGTIMGPKTEQSVPRVRMDHLKEIVKIFCRYFERYPEHYNERARELVHQLLTCGYGVSRESEDGCSILRRVLPMIARVGDVELLPLVEANIMPYEHPEFSLLGLKSKYEYPSISREAREIDAWARQAAFVLENIAAEKAGRAS